jgi:serine/threonine protein kinase
MTVLYNIYNAKEPPKIPENISEPLKDFINCCLKIEPKERMNVCNLLLHPFITGDYNNIYRPPGSRGSTSELSSRIFFSNGTNNTNIQKYTF